MSSTRIHIYIYQNNPDSLIYFHQFFPNESFTLKKLSRKLKANYFTREQEYTKRGCPKYKVF